MTSPAPIDAHEAARLEPVGRVTPLALIRHVFGPRALESLLWGLGIGIVTGIPLMFGYFMVHAVVLELGLQLMGGGSSGTMAEEYFGIYTAAAIVLGASLIVLSGSALLAARLRRANWATIMLVAFMTSFVPYWLLFLLIISPGNV